MSKVREISIKNLTIYFFHDMINIKFYDQDRQKIYKNIFIYYTMYMTPKSAKCCYVINSARRYIEENNGTKYLALTHTDERKNTLK